MPELYQGKIPIVNNSLNDGWIRAAQEVSTGCVERDWKTDPFEMRHSPDKLATYKRGSDWDAVYEEREKQQSSLLHMFLRSGKPAFEHLDQGKFPDCWYYGPSHALMLACMRDGEPIPKINATAGATLLGRTNGGWSVLALKDLGDHGAPMMGTGEGEWPKWTRDTRYNTPAFQATRQKHKVVESFYDIGSAAYDQSVTADQVFTLCANNLPGSGDWNKHGHAMGIVDVVRLERNSWGVAVLNSWSDFGYYGLAILREQWPNNAGFIGTAM